MVVFFCRADVGAASAEDAGSYFSKGEAQLADIYNPGVRDSRQNWLNCAGNFKKAYDCEPDGDYGPVSLYLYGKVYRDLHRFSGNPDDLSTASEAFKKVVSSFPSSTYSHKAAAELDGIPSVRASGSKKNDKNTSDRTDQLQKNQTQKNPASNRKEEKNGAGDIKKPAGTSSFDSIRKENLQKPDRQKSSEKNSSVNKSGSTAKTAVPDITGIRHWTENGYTRIVVDLDSKASYKYGVEKNKKDGLEYIAIDFKKCGISDDTKRERTFGGKIVKNARIIGKEDSVRVLIGVTTAENFNIFPLSGQDDKLKYRIVIDVKGSPKNEEIIAVTEKKSDITVKSSEESKKSDSSASEQSPNKKNEKNDEVADNIKPDNIQDKEASGSKPDDQVAAMVDQNNADYDAQIKKSEKNRVKPSALAKQLALGVRKIVIDPGHGGRDPGAMAQQGIREKDITLSIAKKLAQSLRRRTGCEVLLTRSSDTYLHLEERTAIANTRKADLFISLHLNSSTAREVMGIETYFLNLATDESAIAVAARENATSTKNISDLEGILKDLMRNAKIAESTRLAKSVQKNICVNMSRKYSPIKDKGVKQAPFYVLMGAQMPAILIETGFISNPQELGRLSSADYQSALSDAIAAGVSNYINSVSTSPSYSGKSSHKKTDQKKNRKQIGSEKTSHKKTGSGSVVEKNGKKADTNKSVQNKKVEDKKGSSSKK